MRPWLSSITQEWPGTYEWVGFLQLAGEREPPKRKALETEDIKVSIDLYQGFLEKIWAQFGGNSKATR